MMSVKEYAEDIGVSVEELIEKAKGFGIDVSNENDDLDQDQITILDSNLGVIEGEEELGEDDEEEIYEEEEIQPTVQKLKKKSERIKEVVDSSSDFAADRKKMYKNKKKLVSNAPGKKSSNYFYYKDGMNVKEISEELDVPAKDILKKLMDLGLMPTINDSIPYETLELILVDYKKKIKKAESTSELNFEMFEFDDKEEDLELRPPVVTIMGHVDHGKTTLLDKIRETNVVDGEAGGITQAIGAYQVEIDNKKITFIDTPGHAAFTEMRARGASVTDIVILIVAADDGIMPQTREAIDHAKAANVPIIVAINKMDKEGANPEKLMSELAELGLIPDNWGGETLYNQISALNGEGIDKLLENILLIAEMKELKANPKRYAIGTVIETKVDKKIGTVCTLLIQNGTLRLGDTVVVGDHYCKIRTLCSDKGEKLVSAGPSTPVLITGVAEVPNAGDKFMAFEKEKDARSIAEKRKNRTKSMNQNDNTPTTLEDLFSKITEGVKEVNIILKADVQGSREAVKSSLEKIDVEGVRVRVISAGVGSVTESDISLAKASNAIVIGFNVRPDSKIMDYAKEQKVEVRLYNIIYKVVEDMEAAMKGMLDPVFEEKVTGTAEVLQLFKFSKVGTIAGCKVTDGLIKVNSSARVIRDSVVVYESSISSIQREKESKNEVKKGIECGITVENFNDIKEGDKIETFEMVEVKRK